MLCIVLFVGTGVNESEFIISDIKTVSATAGTFISAEINDDTIWDLSQSPYIVIEDITLSSNSKLTIEAGVEIFFYPGTTLNIRGDLNITGSESNRVTFTSYNGTWQGLHILTHYGGTAIIKFTNFFNANTAIDISPSHPGYPVVKIYDCMFINNSVGLGGYVGYGGTLVDRCLFENNTYGITRTDYDVYNSVFKNNTCGIYQTEKVNVYFSEFFGNQVGLFGGRAEIKFNKIYNNGIGVKGFFEGFTILNNTITNNDIGVIPMPYTCPCNLHTHTPIKFNNIFDNKINLQNTVETEKFAQYNWWGTMNTTEIDLKIYDGLDNDSLGKVSYIPMLTKPVTILLPPSTDSAITQETSFTTISTITSTAPSSTTGSLASPGWPTLIFIIAMLAIISFRMFRRRYR